MQPLLDPATPPSWSDVSAMCRSYLKVFGETAGYTLAQFDEVMSGTDVKAQEEMLQAIFDAI